MAGDKQTPKRKKKPRLQNKVTAETFLVMAQDAREQADLNITDGSAYHTLRLISGIFEREAARLRSKR